jgi:TonB-dependent receptor
MIRHRASILLAVALVLLLGWTAAPAFGQEAGSIRGRVVDGTGTYNLQGAKVQLSETELTTTTDRTGAFRLGSVPPGRYDLIVEYVGAPTTRTPMVVVAGQEQVVTITVGGEASEVVRVVGQAAGQAAALSRERNAIGNINVLSADAIGDFPDNNVAEALQRVSGLALIRDQGEGRFAVIRGANAEFNTTTINGLRVPGPEDDSRAVNLDVIASDLVESVEISKSLMPHQDADAVGGNIEISTLTAFDLGNTIKLAVDGSYNETLEETSPRYSITGTRLLSIAGGEDNFGVSASFNHFDRKFAVDNVESGEWPFLEAPSGGEFRSPETSEQRDYELSRKRIGGTLNFDYRPDDLSSYFLRTLYSDFADNEVELEHEYIFEDGDVVALDANGGVFEGAAVERRGKETTATREILTVVAGGENLVNAWTLDYQVGYAEASTDEPFSLGTALIAEGLDIGYDLSGNRRAPRLFGLDLAALEDVTAYELDLVELESDYTEETEWSFEFNAARELSYGAYPGMLQLGAKLRQREKSNDANNTNFVDFGGDFTLADLVDASPRDYALGRFGPSVDTDRLRAFYFANRANFERDEVDFLLDSEGEDYALDEDILAAYAMTEVTIDRWRLAGGVRVERTEIDQRGARSIVDENDNDGIPTIEPFSASNTYTDIFPNLHALYEFSDAWQLRASLTRTIARPNFEAAGARQLIEIEGSGDDIERVAEIGNPDLEPLYSNNVDVELSYFSPQGLGAASIGVFYKDIEDFFVETDIAGEAPFEAFDEVAVVVNGDDAEVWGVELSYVREFDFLPSPWDGLLFVANYAWIDSEASIPFRDGKIPLPEQAEDVANVALGYEKYGLSLRLAANHRGKYFDGVEDPEDPRQDRYVDDELRVDFTSKYAVNDNLTVIFNVANITDQEFYAYLGDKRAAAQYDEFGRTYEFGIRYLY